MWPSEGLGRATTSAVARTSPPIPLGTCKHVEFVLRRLGRSVRELELWPGGVSERGFGQLETPSNIGYRPTGWSGPLWVAGVDHNRTDITTLFVVMGKNYGAMCHEPGSRTAPTHCLVLQQAPEVVDQAAPSRVSY
jgi:hypothetical protein